MYSIDQSDFCMLLPDLLFYEGQGLFEFAEGGPAIIKLLSYHRVANIEIDKFEDAGIQESCFVQKPDQSEEPLRVSHGKSEEAIASAGLSGQPIPEVDFEPIGCQ